MLEFRAHWNPQTPLQTIDLNEFTLVADACNAVVATNISMTSLAQLLTSMVDLFSNEQ